MTPFPASRAMPSDRSPRTTPARADRGGTVESAKVKHKAERFGEALKTARRPTPRRPEPERVAQDRPMKEAKSAGPADGATPADTTAEAEEESIQSADGIDAAVEPKKTAAPAPVTVDDAAQEDATREAAQPTVAALPVEGTSADASGEEHEASDDEENIDPETSDVVAEVIAPAELAVAAPAAPAQSASVEPVEVKGAPQAAPAGKVGRSGDDGGGDRGAEAVATAQAAGAPHDASLTPPAGEVPPTDALTLEEEKASHEKPAAHEFAAALDAADAKDQPAPVTQPSTHKATAFAPVQIPPEQRFAADNVDNIVKSVQTELMPKGGSMQLRLDPPEIGALSVTVRMNDGVLSASFQTSNDEATKLLSHSLGQLKTALETMGVTVDKINVRQAAPADATPQQGQHGESHSQQNPHDHPARQEQQRREMLQRMWRKLSIGQDPLDMVA